MKYRYGEVIIESRNRDEINDKIAECLSLGYKMGDEPINTLYNDDHSYALIVNSDNYIDVEYKVPVDDYTYISKSELNERK